MVAFCIRADCDRCSSRSRGSCWRPIHCSKDLRHLLVGNLPACFAASEEECKSSTPRNLAKEPWYGNIANYSRFSFEAVRAAYSVLASCRLSEDDKVNSSWRSKGTYVIRDSSALLVDTNFRRTPRVETPPSALSSSASILGGSSCIGWAIWN